jgi:GT2 family glycosyltransferase
MSRYQSARPSISVIVPVHLSGDSFRACLESIARLSPKPLECIVVLDGDDPHSRAVAESFGVKTVRLPGRGGPARARNAGARVARGDVLLFVDSDCSAPLRLVRDVQTLFASDPGLSAVIGSYDASPSAPGFVSQYRNLLHHFVHQTSHGRASTFWGACGALRREVFFSVGGFDEIYTHPAIEDIEMGSRLRRVGHPVRLCKALQVTHHKQWTFGSMLFTDVFRRAAPWSEHILKGGDLPNDLNVNWPGRVSVASVHAIPVAAVASVWTPYALFVLAALLLVFVALNVEFSRFLGRARGVAFALGAVPLHALYFVCCGAGLGIALSRHVLAWRPFERSLPQATSEEIPSVAD